MPHKEVAHPDWAQLLLDAVSKPGVISTAYTAFWNYGVDNQILAMFACIARNIEPGPINTFPGWLKLGRHVRKGEKAITLCMPVSRVGTHKGKKGMESDETPEEHQEVSVRRSFVYRPHWFVLAQTDGDPYVPLRIPEWDEALALQTLAVERVPFAMTDGNCQGYAKGKTIAVSPIAYLPHRTLFHEVAHILLHTGEQSTFSDSDERTPKDVREVEAEAVAYIVCQSLGLRGEAFSRGYLQHWLGNNRISDRSAEKIFHAADLILRAGRNVSRIARREVNKGLKSVRRLTSQHRRDLAALKQLMSSVQRSLSFLERQERTRVKAQPITVIDAEGIRFRADGLRMHRRRPGLSAADYGRLVGASGLSIYHWQTGKTRPREESVKKLAALRGVGKRVAAKRLELL